MFKVYANSIFSHTLNYKLTLKTQKEIDTQSLLNIIFHIQKRNHAPKKHKNIYTQR